MPPVNAEPTSAHHRPPGNAERQCDPELRGDDPVSDLADLLGDRRLGRPAASLRTIAGPEHRLEAGLELGRQRRDLLRDIIDADEARGHERAEHGEVDAARRPFDRVGGGERSVASAVRQAVARSGFQPCGMP